MVEPRLVSGYVAVRACAEARIIMTLNEEHLSIASVAQQVESYIVRRGVEV